MALMVRCSRRRASDESSDLRSVIAGLRDEADAWARVWADTVNAVNRDRRQARVGEISAARGVGERLVDIVAGDDSTEHLRHYLPVLVPTAATRYAPTGGLERF